MRIILQSICLTLLLSASIAAASGFYMTTTLSKEKIDKLSGVSVKATPLGRVFIVTIELSQEKYRGLKKIALERRGKNKQLLLGVPVACKKEEESYIAKIYMSEELMNGSEVFIYLSKEVVTGELKAYYKTVPQNLFGICYKVKLESLK